MGAQAFVAQGAPMRGIPKIAKIRVIAAALRMGGLYGTKAWGVKRAVALVLHVFSVKNCHK